MAQEHLLLETGDKLLLETGDDLLLESSTVDLTIDLPLIDDSTVFGPAVSGAGSIDLPLIDDSAVLAPTLTGTVTISLPLLDTSQVFSPEVYSDQQADLPLLDDSQAFGPTFITDQFLTLPLLEGGWPFAPSVLGAVVDGLQVKVGSTVLDESFARSFRDELTGAGSFMVSLANDDADMPAFDDIVTYWLDGVARFAGRVEAKRKTTFSPGEEVDEVTALTGRGRLAITDQATVEPARGLDALPVEITRSFSWVSVDFDDSAWPASKRIRRSDIRTALPPNRFSPDWWPDKSSWWVWADRSDVSETSAPGGRCLFRQTITLAEDTVVAILAGLDNQGTVYFDGARVMDTASDPSSYTVGMRVNIEASAGEHVLAANVLNTGKGGGLNWTIWTVDDEGLLDELIAHSDSTTTLCLGYPFPNNPPTVTFGWVARQVLEEAQALGELDGWTLGFTDTQDSDGEPWTPVAEITIDVGRTFLEMCESLADWLIDVQAAPGANVLRAWNWGTRGGTPGVTVAVTTNPNTSEVEALSHDGRHIRANRLLIRYRQGYTEVIDDDADPDDIRTMFLDLGDVDTESTAQGIGNRLLANRKDPIYAHTLTLAPVGSTPYADFDNGDYITHRDENEANDSLRVRSIALSEDEDGELTWVLETNEIRQEIENRHENWLKRKAMGALAGGARVSSRSGEPLEPAVRISTTDVAEFSFDTPFAGMITGKRPASSSGNLIEIYVEVTTDDGSEPTTDTEVEVYQYVHGTLTPASIGTVTVPAGEFVGELDLEASKAYRNIYKYRAETVTVGGGVTGVDVQLRAI